MAEDRRPVKVVIPDAKRDYHSRPPGGGAKKPFAAPADHVEKLLDQLAIVEQTFGATLAQKPPIPVVVRVKMKEKAIAKSHRPFELFTDDTCPIIGAQDLGELLVSVEHRGLQKLRSKMNYPTKINKVALTKIESIEPYAAAQVVGIDGVDELRQLATKEGVTLKIRLFDHRDRFRNAHLQRSFNSLVKAISPHDDPVQLQYARGLNLFKLKVKSANALEALVGFVGVQSVDEMPGFVVDVQEVTYGPITDDMIPLPTAGLDYPVVGLLDSGTNQSNARLQAWVVGRDEQDVPPGDQDNRHGSFIAGLLINARGLNHNDPRFPSGCCKIFDAVVMPKAGGNPHPEDELLKSIRRVIDAHHRQVKVWNLSISSLKAVCSDLAFSQMSIALDEIQDKYGVTIVTCTGNLKPDKVCPWPRNNAAVGESDRMFPAADSVRALSVASLAHKESHDSISKKEQPSPFSRRGPGPAFHPKPELSHYGGNCNAKGHFAQTGILSVDHKNVVERVGTSYSTPLISKLLGGLRHSVAKPISRNLAKAMLIHSAVLNQPNLTIDELRYRGFGVPSAVEELLNCSPWQATLIFEPKLEPDKSLFEMKSFPIPPCFRKTTDGSVEGEFLMTLVYDPPLDAGSGPEYCRVNVDLSLGTYDKDKNGRRNHHGKIPLEPTDASDLFEDRQLEHGFKWSPVKVYRKRMCGIAGDMWRILIDTLHRSESEKKHTQHAAIIVTMFDRAKPTVYDEVMREMIKNGWVSEDLQVRPRLRLEGEA